MGIDVLLMSLLLNTAIELCAFMKEGGELEQSESLLDPSMLLL
jgi:hypothetical protein